jgi:hypothetical protein
MDIVERMQIVLDGMISGADDWTIASQIYEYQTAIKELRELRAFKAACEGQEAVAQVYGRCVSGFTDVIDLNRYSNEKLRKEKLYRYPDPEAAQLRVQVAKLTEQRDLAVDALKKLLQRDMRNTCQHEETHRGGVIWEICDSCGASWEDHLGGKPEWKDPIEWVHALAAIQSIGEDK